MARVPWVGQGSLWEEMFWRGEPTKPTINVNLETLSQRVMESRVRIIRYDRTIMNKELDALDNKNSSLEFGIY